jgi:hypothetical protein
VDTKGIDTVLALLTVDDLVGTRRLLDSYETAGWIGHDEAAEWAARIHAWRQFHELDAEAARPA